MLRGSNSRGRSADYTSLGSGSEPTYEPDDSLGRRSLANWRINNKGASSPYNGSRGSNAPSRRTFGSEDPRFYIASSQGPRDSRKSRTSVVPPVRIVAEQQNPYHRYFPTRPPKLLHP